MMTLSLVAALAAGLVVEPSQTVCTLRYVARSRSTVSQCLSCHDGTASWLPIGVASGHMDGGGGHPVAVRYGRPDGPRLFPVPRNARIVLPRGEVGCVSCHDGSGFGPAHLATPADELCNGCHDA